MAGYPVRPWRCRWPGYYCRLCKRAIAVGDEVIRRHGSVEHHGSCPEVAA